MNLRHLAMAALVAATATAAQQPFQLDAGFHLNVQSIAVGDVLERPDGKIIVSGNMRYPSWDNQRSGLLVEPSGTIIPSPTGPDALYWGMGGKIVPWGADRFYVKNGQGIRRLWMDGNQDTTFNDVNHPLYSIMQGGDFHVFPDGRLLIAGNHWLKDTVRGFVGWEYGLVWLNTDGSLDTTRIHRSIGGPFGSLSRIGQLPDGKFLCAGGSGTFEGEPVSGIFRVHSNGSLDTTFNAPLMDWGQWDCMLPQPGGRVIVSGRWRFSDGPDVSLVRFLPNGQIDPTFNSLDFECTYNTSTYWPIVSHVEPIGNGMLAITGWFDRINGEVHGGIAMIDTAGNLLPGYFEGSGCGGYLEGTSNQTWRQNILGIEPAQDGGYFIYGAYHGYDDGTGTDGSNQRLMSKLYGLNVGIAEHAAGQPRPLQIAPNPSAGSTLLAVEAGMGPATLTIHDASGRLVLQEAWPAGAYTCTLQAGQLAPGAYVVRVQPGAAGAAAQDLAGGYVGRLVVMP